jgi:hypothetical protein
MEPHMPNPTTQKSRSLLTLALILLFGGFVLNTTFMVLGIHGYLRELTRFTTIAGLVLTIVAIILLLWRAIAARVKKKK